MRVANASKIKTGMGTKFFGENDQWIYVTRGGIEANPKGILKDDFGPGDIHLIKSNDHFQNFLDSVKTRELTITPAEVACRFDQRRPAGRDRDADRAHDQVGSGQRRDPERSGRGGAAGPLVSRALEAGNGAGYIRRNGKLKVKN